MQLTGDTEARRVLVKVRALSKSVRRALASDGMEQNRYASAKSFAAMYNGIVPRYNKLLPSEPQGVFDLDTMKGWADSLWPEQKQICETIETHISIMEAMLVEVLDVEGVAEIEFYNFVEANLRRAIFEQPSTELEFQNSLESILVGRGWRREKDYLRESGKVSFSGKEFIPDFVLLEANQAIEVKLLKDLKKRTKMVEEMSADLPAYLSKYDSVYFVVYDVAGLRDEAELRSGLEASGSANLSLIKH